MIAPTMLAVAAIFSALNRYGSAVGKRSFQRIVHGVAAYERMSSSDRWSAACRPRSVAIATGKKVRYEAITATAIHGVTWKVELGFVNQMTTIGAIARIGTVCEATT